MGSLLPRTFPLTSTFFGLTVEYKPNLLDEIYICTHHLGFTRRDVMEMPTYERRHYINNLKGEIDKRNELIEDAKTTSKNGKGKTTKTVSGEALKNKMRSGEIN